MFGRTDVLVLPGLAAGDLSTAAIRSSLAAQGHRVHRWNLGRNHPTPELHDALKSRFFDLIEQCKRPIALVGWSLGGLYAHRLATFAPYDVRCVITMGSPLNGSRDELASLDVPTTSIYTRSDRIVPWTRSVVDVREPRHENIEVRSTHVTLGIDPFVLLVIGDRVRTDPDRWKPFRAPPLLGGAYPQPPDAR